MSIISNRFWLIYALFSFWPSHNATLILLFQKYRISPYFQALNSRLIFDFIYTKNPVKI